MIPGITVLPARSIVRAPAGGRTLDAGPTSAMRPFWMTTVWLGFGAAPVPSMIVTFVRATTGSLTLTYCRTCCESDAAACADTVERGRASWAATTNDATIRMRGAPEPVIADV